MPNDYDENTDFGAAGLELPMNFSDWHLHVLDDGHGHLREAHSKSAPGLHQVTLHDRYDAVLDTPEGVSVAVTVPKKGIIDKHQEISCNRLMAGIPSPTSVRFFQHQ